MHIRPYPPTIRGKTFLSDKILCQKYSLQLLHTGVNIIYLKESNMQIKQKTCLIKQYIIAHLPKIS